jgi:hypothetical protein
MIWEGFLHGCTATGHALLDEIPAILTRRIHGEQVLVQALQRPAGEFAHRRPKAYLDTFFDTGTERQADWTEDAPHLKGN